MSRMLMSHLEQKTLEMERAFSGREGERMGVVSLISTLSLMADHGMWENVFRIMTAYFEWHERCPVAPDELSNQMFAFNIVYSPLKIGNRMDIADRIIDEYGLPVSYKR